MQWIRRVACSNALGVVVAGLALGLAPAYGWWPVALVGIALTVYVIQRTTSYQQAVSIGFLIGLLRSLIAVGWFWSVYPMDWMGIISHTLQIALVCFYWFYVALPLALGYILLAAVVFWLRRRSAVWSLVGIPTAWLMADAIGAFMFSLTSYGPGARIGTDFSFGYIGYAAVTHTGLLQLARLSGIWTLSGGLVLSAVVLKTLWTSQDKRAVVGVGIVLLLTSTSVGWSHPMPAGTRSVALIDTQFPSETKTLGFDFRGGQLVGAVMAALQSSADTIILPEDSRFTLTFPDPKAALAFIVKNAHRPVVVIDSARVPVGNHVVLRAFIYDTRADTYYAYDKQYLVPQGELVPYITRFLASQIPLGKQAETVINDMVYRPGISQSSVSVPSYVPAVLFCFESVTPTGVAVAVRGRTQTPFVAHVVSHDWFNGQPTLLERPLDAMLRVQAIWNQLPIYMATNDATPAVYEPNGQIDRPQPVLETPYWSIAIVPSV